MAIDQLAHQFDLIVIDHPWAGFAFEKNLVHDLKALLPPSALNELKQNSIGATFESYCYGEKLLALPIDAAAPRAKLATGFAGARRNTYASNVG